MIALAHLRRVRKIQPSMGKGCGTLGGVEGRASSRSRGAGVWTLTGGLLGTTDIREINASGKRKRTIMSSHPTDFQGSVIDALREAIEQQIDNSQARVDGGGGHFNIDVTSPVFAGMSTLERQRLVYGAIAHLMRGDRPPVHAVDSLKTRTPAAS
ncbi:BolA family protein [Nitrobacter sp. 62-13]|jgi:acid stress-induced BolA-like protein IbaG/YrbA|uniref:BolA family protein n=1 Tax=Nitrobacter sp. 62-13 TaxID=1895797 RepID=UPI00344C6AE0